MGIFAEDEADGLGRGYASAGVGEQSRLHIATIDFHLIGIAACHQQKLSVGTNGKIPGMPARGLVSHGPQGAVRSYGENADAVSLQTV